MKQQWIIYRQTNTNKIYLTSFRFYGEDGINYCFIDDKKSAFVFNDEAEAQSLAIRLKGSVKEVPE